MKHKNGPDFGYLFKTATPWRRRAEKMRKLAEEAEDATVRSMMLRIAADYDHRALNANDPAAQHTIMFQPPNVNSERSPRPPRSGLPHMGEANSSVVEKPGMPCAFHQEERRLFAVTSD